MVIRRFEKSVLHGLKLFQERLSEKAHATIPKGIVHGSP